MPQYAEDHIATVREAASDIDERRLARLRRGLRGLAYVTNAAIGAISTSVTVAVLTAPEAAATVASRLRP